MNRKIEQYFILIVVIFAITALVVPSLVTPFKSFIPVGLGLIMFGIGINTPVANLTNTLAKPGRILGLIVIRYIAMPFFALLISHVFHLTRVETIGLLVLGTAPGGTAANVMAYLSGSNVALTVILTFGSTILSPFVTPTLIYLLLHQQITIDFWGMVLHIATIIFVPITAGLIFNRYKSPVIAQIKQWMPAASMLMVAFLIACILGLNQTAVLKFPVMAILAVLCLNISGYLTGAVSARALKWENNSVLSAAFDYGMFDAAVAMVICTTFFGQETAVPAVLMSITQNLTAPLIVKYLNPGAKLVNPSLRTQ